MNIKELFVSIKVNVNGLKKLQNFNKELKEVIASMGKLQRTMKSSNVAKAEKNLVDADNVLDRQPDNRKSGLFDKLGKAPIVASLIYIGRTFLDVTRKVSSFVVSISQASYELLKLNRNFGVSTSALQAFGYEAVANGVKMSDFNSAIANLRKQSADILLGRGNISPYALLGLNPHEDPEKLLVHLQQRLRELPESIGTAFASDLGLSPDMINFIRRGDFARMQARPKLSGNELRVLERTRNLLLDVSNMFSLLGQKIMTYLAPYIEIVFGRLNYYIRETISHTDNLAKAIKVAIVGIEVAMFMISPKLAVILNILSAIALIIDDIATSGGRGILIWIDYLTNKITNAISRILGITDEHGNLTKMGKHLVEDGDAMRITNPAWATAGGDSWAEAEAKLEQIRKLRSERVQVGGKIRVENSRGEGYDATVGDSSSGSDITFDVTDTSLSGTAGD